MKWIQTHGNKGLTLIELLVVVAIVAILAAIASVGYSNYMQRARRADGKVCLEQLRGGQEMRRAEMGSYSTNLVELQNTWGISTSCGDYVLELNSASATGFTGEAKANAPRQVSDGNLFIDQDGNKTPADKWAK